MHTEAKASCSPRCRLIVSKRPRNKGAVCSREGATRTRTAHFLSNADGRCLSTSHQTASGTSTSEKSLRRSRQSNSSKWLSGPASQTTTLANPSAFAMQAPIHIILDHRFGQVPAVRLEEAAQRLGQQLVHVRRPAFLDERARPIRQFGWQLGLNYCCGSQATRVAESTADSSSTTSEKNTACCRKCGFGRQGDRLRACGSR